MLLQHEMFSIGNDVWVGCNAVIMPGVIKSDGTAIGTGSIMTHDVNSYEVVGGAPAKHLRWRFKDEIINKLEDRMVEL